MKRNSPRHASAPSRNAPAERTPRGGRNRPGSRKPNTLARLARVSPRTYVMIAVVVLFLVLSVSPVTRNIEATHRLRDMESELNKQKALTASLEKDVEEAKSLEYIEKEARRQRLVAPGEVLYLISSEQDDSSIHYKVKSLQSMDEAWERLRRMLHCTAGRGEAKVE